MARKFLNRLGDAIGDIGRYAADYQIAERDRKYKETQDQGEVDRWEREFAANRGDAAQEREDRLSTERRMGDRAVTAGAIDAELDANDPVKRVANAKARLLENLAGGVDIESLTEGQRLLVGYDPDKGNRTSTKSEPSYSDMYREKGDRKKSVVNSLLNQAIANLQGADPDRFNQLTNLGNTMPKSGYTLQGMMRDPEFFGEGGMNPSDSSETADMVARLIGAENTPTAEFDEYDYEGGAQPTAPDPIAAPGGGFVSRQPQILTSNRGASQQGEMTVESYIQDHPEFYQMPEQNQTRLIELLMKRGYK